MGWFQASHAGDEVKGKERPPFGTRLDNQTLGVDWCVPKPVHRVPSKMVLHNKMGEVFIRAHLTFEDIVHDGENKTRSGNTHMAHLIGTFNHSPKLSKWA